MKPRASLPAGHAPGAGGVAAGKCGGGDTVYKTGDSILPYLLRSFGLPEQPIVRPDSVRSQLADDTPGRKIFVIDRWWKTDPAGKDRDTLRADPWAEEARFSGLHVFVVPAGDREPEPVDTRPQATNP